MRRMRFVLFLVALLWSTLAVADGRMPPPGQTAIKASLVAESQVPATGGEVTLAIEMRPDAGWHGYWSNPGEAGVPPRIAWTLPAGVGAGALRFPTPQPLMISGIMNYVYEGPYAHLVTLRVPAGMSGTVPLRAKFEWLACTDEVCVPEEGELALDLSVGAGGADAATRARFDRHRAALPVTLDRAGTVAREGERFRLALPLPGVDAAGAYFFPAEDGRVSYSAPQTASRAGDLLLIETAANGPVQPVSGVLRLADGRGFAVRAEPGTVPRADALAPVWSVAGLAFLGAVLGGLILNVMPCVFPILSLKALSLAKAGGDERGARREALAYTAGAVATAAALGGVLLALRAGGEAVGWAFQLQNPVVVFALLLLTVAISLNLAGLFELPAIGGRFASDGTGGAFGTGALAMFIATPCTGPFMGGALGAILVLPAAAALLVFVGLGLGLALPFLALGFVPALRRRLPKPGPWLGTFRRVMALPMAATAVALAWVLGRQTGVDGMALALFASLVLGVALWMWGARQRREIEGSGGRSRMGWAIPVAAAAVAFAFTLPRSEMGAVTNRSADAPLGAERFSEARLTELQAAGRPVFVYFTADWCVSCKVNESVAISRPQVAEAFGRAEVATLVGDWTNADPQIGRFLASQGRTGVPLYLFYRPGQRAPEVLPQVLTPGRLTALVG